MHLFCKKSLHIFIFFYHAAIEKKYLFLCRMKKKRLINSTKLRSLCFQNWFFKHFYFRFLICNITIYIWMLFFFLLKLKAWGHCILFRYFFFILGSTFIIKRLKKNLVRFFLNSVLYKFAYIELQRNVLVTPSKLGHEIEFLPQAQIS